MNLHQTLSAIAVQLNLDAALLKVYADEDAAISGYHPDETLTKWPSGSIFGVEGQILYALVRALQPELVVEFGTFHGCSASHFLAALSRNGHGRLITVDVDDSGWSIIDPGDMEDRFELIIDNALEWTQSSFPVETDFVFEDMKHTVETTSIIWQAALKHAQPGTVIVSHDAAHFSVGENVRQGIMQAGGQAQVYLTEPSNCGLAIGRKN